MRESWSAKPTLGQSTAISRPVPEGVIGRSASSAAKTDVGAIDFRRFVKLDEIGATRKFTTQNLHQRAADPRSARDAMTGLILLVAAFVGCVLLAVEAVFASQLMARRGLAQG